MFSSVVAQFAVLLSVLKSADTDLSNTPMESDSKLTRRHDSSHRTEITYIQPWKTIIYLYMYFVSKSQVLKMLLFVIYNLTNWKVPPPLIY